MYKVMSSLDEKMMIYKFMATDGGYEKYRRFREFMFKSSSDNKRVPEEIRNLPNIQNMSDIDHLNDDQARFATAAIIMILCGALEPINLINSLQEMLDQPSKKPQPGMVYINFAELRSKGVS